MLAQEEVPYDWAAFYQLISIEAEAYTSFKLTGAVKANGDQPDANDAAALWARVEKADGTPAFFDNMADRLITAKEWNKYIIQGDITSDDVNIYFGGLVVGSGSFFFDALKLEFKKADGTWTTFDLKDGGFEAEVEGNKMKYWLEGIHISTDIRSVKYSISASMDAYEGKKSLLIKRRKNF
ncbi:hypothetical protein BFP71_08000 [Roseivirga misakiensis]|uniref:Uncharacterized protein n=2 Tax=Roseivirga misakiensis TaxID=1563681 RepID=A0A1E5SK67_9BACT|nr:hypothetical protein BFP71_08000 [Roseivirga misakiensis]